MCLHKTRQGGIVHRCVTKDPFEQHAMLQVVGFSLLGERVKLAASIPNLSLGLTMTYGNLIASEAAHEVSAVSSWFVFWSRMQNHADNNCVAHDCKNRKVTTAHCSYPT